jgi:hypothetical protein
MLKGNSNKKVGFRLDFFGEFEAIFETALAHESGPLGGIVWWKKSEGRKSRDTVPLSKKKQRFFIFISFLLASINTAYG